MQNNREINKDKKTSYFSRFFEALHHLPPDQTPPKIVYPLRLSDPGGGAVDLNLLDPAGPLIFNPDIVYYAE